MKTINIAGINISCITAAELNDYIANVVKSKGKEAVLNVNIHCMNLISANPWMRDVFTRAAVTFCDGDGVRILSLFSQNKIPEKITYNRWILSFFDYCQKNRFSVFFLGSTKEIVNKSVVEVQAKFPDLQICGQHDGFFEGREADVVQMINSVKPDIVLLGMGMPLQERFINEYHEKIATHVFLTGGAVFSYLSGFVKTTPPIFFRLKLEWLYRVYQEPRRLFGRYFFGIPLFYLKVLKWHFFKK
jgi:N-acetylglucosaminyldiphosphoundecaprenol N-acetyl-beta-D-mannosaminyltransferase